MELIFVQLAAILFTAFIVSYIVRSLNQPIIIGYILAGIIVSPFLIKIGASTDIIKTFSEIGISFLLFIVGLHLNPKVIKEIGASSLFIGLLQVILTALFGYGIANYLLHFDVMTSFYIGIGLAFSSTIIIMKLLSDQKQLDSLYGKLSIGILILQDLVAIGVLMFVSSISGDLGSQIIGLRGVIAGIVIILILFFFGKLVLPRMMKSIAKSQELLFLFSICWCFVLAALFTYVGFSMEIGSLIAGVMLSVSPYANEISSKIRPLRDFFIIIFFIILGLQLKVTNIQSILINSIILSGIVLILKPLFTMIIMRFFGYTKRTNFLVGSGLAQVSEFSLILFGIGVSLGQINEVAMQTMILTMILTIFVSSYFIAYSTKFYTIMSPILGVFQKRKIKRQAKISTKYDTILFGYNRIGFSILNALKKMKSKYLVVDYNPDTITNLKKFGIPSLYGDVYDLELLDDLPLNNLSLAISTIPEVDTNLLLIESIRELNKECVIILRAHSIEDALKLYDAGANYVLTPHFLGGEYVAKMIKHSSSRDEDYVDERKKHIKMLKQMVEKGEEHPRN